MSGLTYKSVGVDVDRKQAALRAVRERVARAKRPEVIGDIGAFAGLFRFGGYRDPVLVATTDGVGTKIEVARMLDRHEVVGADVVVQSVNDALAMGAEPLFFLDYFSTGRIDPDVLTRVVGAIADACAAHRCALLGGETAEMPDVYGPGVYDLAGFLVGGVERERVLDPTAVREGDVCVGLPSTGLHTNGYTLARAIVARVGDPLDVLQRPWPELRGGTLGEALLEPHRSYLDDVRRLRDAVRVRSIAHITGGSWEGNLPRALTPGLGAIIDRSTWIVPPVFTLLARLGDIAADEQWRTWNMGIGMVVIVPADDERAALRTLPDAVTVGRVVRSEDKEEGRVRFVG